MYTSKITPSPESADAALYRGLAKLGPYRLDVRRDTPVWTFVVRDKDNRHLAEVNKYLPDREIFAEVLPHLLNGATADTLALDAIARLLDGTEWGADTLADIATLLTDTGRVLHDVDGAALCQVDQGDADIQSAASRVMPLRRPGVVIVVEGGLISDVAVSEPMDILIIDYDHEGTQGDELCQVDQGDVEPGEDETATAVVALAHIDIDAEYVHGRLDAFRATGGKAC